MLNSWLPLFNEWQCLIGSLVPYADNDELPLVTRTKSSVCNLYDLQLSARYRNVEPTALLLTVPKVSFQFERSMDHVSVFVLDRVAMETVRVHLVSCCSQWPSLALCCIHRVSLCIYIVFDISCMLFVWWLCQCSLQSLCILSSFHLPFFA